MEKSPADFVISSTNQFLKSSFSSDQQFWRTFHRAFMLGVVNCSLGKTIFSHPKSYQLLLSPPLHTECNKALFTPGVQNNATHKKIDLTKIAQSFSPHFSVSKLFRDCRNQRQTIRY